MEESDKPNSKKKKGEHIKVDNKITKKFIDIENMYPCHYLRNYECNCEKVSKLKCNYIGQQSNCFYYFNNANRKNSKLYKNSVQYDKYPDYGSKIYRGKNVFELKKEQYSNKPFQSLDWTGQKKLPIVYIFHRWLPFQKNDDSLTDYLATIWDISHEKRINIMVVYSSRTNRYYASKNQILHHVKSEYKPHIKLKVCGEGGWGVLNEFSELSLYGYTAQEDKLEEGDRRAILMWLICYRLMRPGNIISHLNGLIDLRSEQSQRDYSKAINVWRSDIEFIDEYCATKEYEKIDLMYLGEFE